MENTFKFYTWTRDTWEAMLQALRGAQTSIDIEHYIFLPDELGERFLEVIRERARAGVKVRLHLDTVGSYGMYNSQIPDELRQLGVEIKFFNVVSPWRIHNFTSWFFRDHNKIFLIDKKVAFLGGTGLQHNMATWRDTNAAIRGGVVEEVAATFEEMWNMREKHFFKRIMKVRARTLKKYFISNIPYFKKRFLYYAFIKAIRNARGRVWLTTPYFVPDYKFMKELRRAAKRGVDVKIIVPKVLDVYLVGTAANSFVQGLLIHGVKIYKYEKAILHAKTAVVDGGWATFGSFNLDSISFDYNFEGNVVMGEGEITEELARHFEEDLKDSREIKLEEWKRRPFINKLEEFLIIPIRGFL